MSNTETLPRKLLHAWIGIDADKMTHLGWIMRDVEASAETNLQDPPTGRGQDVFTQPLSLCTRHHPIQQDRQDTSLVQSHDVPPL